VNTAALVSKRMVLAVAAISVLTWYVVNQIGPGVSYAKLASQMSVEQALVHTRAIVDLQQDDPGFGTPGARAAAEYIAARLEEYGALPAASTQDYLQLVERRLVRRLSAPVLEASPDGEANWLTLAHGTDFGETIARHGGSGEADGQLVFVGFGSQKLTYGDYRGLDLRGRVVAVLAENMPAEFDNEALIRGATAVLLIAPAESGDEDVTPRLDYLSDADDVLVQPTIPIVRVRPRSIERWLEPVGHSLSELEQLVADLQSAGTSWSTLELPLRVHARVELSAPEVVTGYNVLAILPGNDLAMDEQALVLTSAYDLPEPDPGNAFVAASDGPAGVGIILEMVRLWQQEDFKPRRAVLIALYAGGFLDSDGALTYLQERTPYQSLLVQGTLRLGSVGAGQGLVVEGDDSALKGLLQRSAGVLSVPLAGAGASARSSRAGVVAVAWDGAPDPYAGEDVLANLDVERLAQAGQVVNLAMITASRQYHY
jgi:hypothetical protein